MKVALINGSPKVKDSASQLILDALVQRLGSAAEPDSCHATQGQEAVATTLSNSDAIVFVFPLYVDSIPSHLLRLMSQLSANIATLTPDAVVYAIANNGFYEGDQNKLALEIVRNFCIRSGLAWGQGLGIGGGMMASMGPIGQGLLKYQGLALDALAQAILDGSSAADVFIQPTVPRFIFKQSGEAFFKQEAKKHGLRTKQLYQIP